MLSSPRLPELPAEVERRLREELHRGEERWRQAIDAESERTIVEDEETTRLHGSRGAQPELAVGKTIAVPRRVRAGTGVRQIVERFTIKEQLSSASNISGDVFRAERFWDEQRYGDVVLKTPKAELVRDRSGFDFREEMGRELRNLFRFEGHCGILAPSGKPFVWNSELVIQARYHPWGFVEYLKYFSDEGQLSAALATLAAQCLAAIDFMAATRDEEGPQGYAHVDLKTTHLRLDFHAGPPEGGEWVVTLIDLDSVFPAGPIDYHGAKYNRGCVDPEKFMNLDEPGTLVTADPAETIYALGLTLLSAIAQLLGTGLERRGFRPLGLGQGEDGVVLEDAWSLREEVERTRAVDRANFLRAYHVNRVRRLELGAAPDDPEELAGLLAGEPTLGPDFRDEGAADCPVAPRIFVAILECLRRRSERQTAAELQALFKSMAASLRAG
jgi:hypothetical protein